MNKKLLGPPIAGLLLIGGATAVLAQSGASPQTPSTAPAADASASPTTGAGVRIEKQDTVLSDVLESLVADGTITQAQADAITNGVTTRREELRAEHEALREQLRTFIEDGVISADELAQLPADHPLRTLDTLLDDGQITLDELRQLGGRGLGFGGRGHFHGPGFFGDKDGTDDAAPSASPDADGSSTG